MSIRSPKISENVSKKPITTSTYKLTANRPLKCCDNVEEQLHVIKFNMLNFNGFGGVRINKCCFSFKLPKYSGINAKESHRRLPKHGSRVAKGLGLMAHLTQF